MMKNYLLIAFIIGMIFLYALAIPLAKKKSKKAHLQHQTDFQQALKVGDRVLMAAGIIGEIKELGGETMLLKIADQTIIEIDKMAVVGKI